MTNEEPEEVSSESEREVRGAAAKRNLTAKQIKTNEMAERGEMGGNQSVAPK
jgi:hypothetical protein